MAESDHILVTQHLLIRLTASVIIFGIGGDMNNVVVSLRETQRTSKLNINFQKINFIDIVVVYDKIVSINFWRIPIVTGVLPNRDSETRGAIVRMAETNATLKRPVNKLFTVRNTYDDANQTDKAAEQKLR